MTARIPCGTNSTSAVPFRVLSLCTGIAGDVAAFQRAAIADELIAVAEFDPVASAVLAQKFLLVPNLDDLTQVTYWRTYHGRTDILIAGIPRQPFSIAGRHRGHSDKRDLTPEMLDIICEIEPRRVVIENVPQFATTQGGTAFRKLRRKLEQAGYAIGHHVFDAAKSCPNAADGCSFSLIAEAPSPHLLKYSLTSRAAAGVLNRAERYHYHVTAPLLEGLLSCIRRG